jgi:hypothetical protein
MRPCEPRGAWQVVEYLLNPVKDIICIDRPDEEFHAKVKTGAR